MHEACAIIRPYLDVVVKGGNAAGESGQTMDQAKRKGHPGDLQEQLNTIEGQLSTTHACGAPGGPLLAIANAAKWWEMASSSRVGQGGRGREREFKLPWPQPQWAALCHVDYVDYRVSISESG